MCIPAFAVQIFSIDFFFLSTLGLSLVNALFNRSCVVLNSLEVNTAEHVHSQCFTDCYIDNIISISFEHYIHLSSYPFS